MNVLIAVMPRTASTAIFNIVRFIFEEKEMEYYSCLKYDKSKEKENNVLKIHQYSPKFENGLILLFYQLEILGMWCVPIIIIGESEL